MQHSRGGGGQAQSSELAEQVFREQLRLAFDLLPVAIVANTVLTLAVFAVLVRIGPALQISAWTGGMLALIGVRAVAVWHYRRTPPEERQYQRYAAWYFFPYLLTGLGWSLLAAFLVPEDQEVYAVLSMCAVYGLAAGGVAFLGHMREWYGAYLLVTLLPAAAKWLALWFQFGGDFRLVMGVTSLVFIVLLYSASAQLSRLVARAVAVSAEKEALARRLQDMVTTVEGANQAKGEFIARMSREVYAPTEAVASRVQELLEQAERGRLPAEQRKMLHDLQAGAEDLLEMLGNVLDYSSLEAGQLQIELGTFDLREMIARTARTVDERAHAKGLAFACVVAGEVPALVIGDARRLAQILDHLLDNAIKFSERGTVRLEVKRVGGDAARPTLAFMVSDTGIGIPAQRLREVFQPFAHKDGPGAGQQRGSGLGLAICRRLSALMLGVLAVESEPGHGSVFTLMLSLQRA